MVRASRPECRRGDPLQKCVIRLRGPFRLRKESASIFHSSSTSFSSFPDVLSLLDSSSCPVFSPWLLPGVANGGTGIGFCFVRDEVDKILVYRLQLSYCKCFLPTNCQPRCRQRYEHTLQGSLVEHSHIQRKQVQLDSHGNQ